MTWNEFKEKVESELTEEQMKSLEIFYIDTGSFIDAGSLYVTVSDEGKLAIS